MAFFIVPIGLRFVELTYQHSNGINSKKFVRRQKISLINNVAFWSIEKLGYLGHKTRYLLDQCSHQVAKPNSRVGMSPFLKLKRRSRIEC